MLVNCSGTKRPREALLQLDIELEVCMFSIGGSRKAPVRYHPCVFLILTPGPESGRGTVSGG